MEIGFHPQAELELRALRKQSVTEHGAMLNALAKLEALGVDLGFPHSSQVKGTRLRELRPRPAALRGARFTPASVMCFVLLPSALRRSTIRTASKQPWTTPLPA